MLNYVEGQVTIAGQPVTSQSVGSMQLEPNQVMETGQGRAEILLTPGIFVRIGDHSSLRMISAKSGGYAGTTASRRGHRRSRSSIRRQQYSHDGGRRFCKAHQARTVCLQCRYRQVSVFDGKAVVAKRRSADRSEKRPADCSGRSALKPTHFDTKAAERQDPLYAWSRLRSEYDAEAAMQSASTVVVGGPGWWGPGWYWNPWWGMYSFLPGAVILYSPFGWPYYSPGFSTRRDSVTATDSDGRGLCRSRIR